MQDTAVRFFYFKKNEREEKYCAPSPVRRERIVPDDPESHRVVLITAPHQRFQAHAQKSFRLASPTTVRNTIFLFHPKPRATQISRPVIGRYRYSIDQMLCAAWNVVGEDTTTQ